MKLEQGAVDTLTNPSPKEVGVVYTSVHHFEVHSICLFALGGLASIPATVLGKTDVPFFSNAQMLIQKMV
jgi:hypothetical protein